MESKKYKIKLVSNHQFTYSEIDKWLKDLPKQIDTKAIGRPYIIELDDGNFMGHQTIGMSAIDMRTFDSECHCIIDVCGENAKPEKAIRYFLQFKKIGYVSFCQLKKDDISDKVEYLNIEIECEKCQGCPIEKHLKEIPQIIGSQAKGEPKQWAFKGGGITAHQTTEHGSIDVHTWPEIRSCYYDINMFKKSFSPNGVIDYFQGRAIKCYKIVENR
jgi:S-adenosylmethionine/arginine decarboxylase-like enzyme